eukprot:1149523-Pelagomonas_calceolata.AAC.12
MERLFTTGGNKRASKKHLHSSFRLLGKANKKSASHTAQQPPTALESSSQRPFPSSLHLYMHVSRWRKEPPQWWQEYQLFSRTRRKPAEYKDFA